jgi:hypothetical protein
LNEREKQFRNPGKGENELFEIANPLVLSRGATKVVELRVSENRGMHMQHVILASVTELAEKSITATNPTQKSISSPIFHYWALTL